MKYYLMNKDVPLVEFCIEKSKFGTEIITDEKIIGKIFGWFSSMEKWLEGRNYAKHKRHLKNYLNKWGLNTYSGFITMTKCLGLNDTLWVKKADSRDCWSTVNLYSNSFNDIAEQTAFEEGIGEIGFSGTSPEITSEGSFGKCWKKIDNEIFLIKKGSEDIGIEPYTEYFSSQIAGRLCAKSVAYDLIDFKGHISTRCKSFTDERYGFVPFYRFCEEKEISKIIDFFNKAPYSQWYERFVEMIVLDSVIVNPDRHVGNFGFLIDNESFEIVDLAPIFDFNLSLEAFYDIDDVYEHIRKRDFGHALGGDFIQVARVLKNKKTENVLKEMKDFKFDTNELCSTLPESKISIMEELVKCQIQLILE